MEAAKSITWRQTSKQLFFFVLTAVSLLGVEYAIGFAKDGPRTFSRRNERIIENYYRSGGPSKGLPPA